MIWLLLFIFSILEFLIGLGIIFYEKNLWGILVLILGFLTFREGVKDIKEWGWW